eukprot:3756155-Amphidinium_carterae.1
MAFSLEPHSAIVAACEEWSTGSLESEGSTFSQSHVLPALRAAEPPLVSEPESDVTGHTTPINATPRRATISHK